MNYSKVGPETVHCKKSAAALLLVCVGAPLAAGVTGSSIITTFAGAGWTFLGDGGPALNAPLSALEQLSTDPNGNIIFADTGNHVVSRLNSDGTVTLLAGNGIRGLSGDDGPARSAALNEPCDAVMDRAGNLYIYDSTNFRIRRVTPDGIISTYAGTGVPGSSGDNGPAKQATIQALGKLAIDTSGTLYLTDPTPHSVVRRITPDGIISTYAGNGQPGHSGENVPATQVPLTIARGGIALDRSGNLYIVEAYDIRKVTPDGLITTIAGTGISAGYQDGPAASALFAIPRGIAVAANGDVYIGDGNNQVVRKLSTDGIVSTVAGVLRKFDYSGDGGPALSATFRFPEGLAFDGNGVLYVADKGNKRIRSISTDSIVNTVAGNAQFRNSPDRTPASRAFLFGPNGVSSDSQGNLLIADLGNARVRRVTRDGGMDTVAGNGVSGFGGSFGGPATQLLLSAPRMVVGDGQGNIYIADFTFVYRVRPDGTIVVVAGDLDGTNRGQDNIPGFTSALLAPTGLALDQAGSLYIADAGDHRIRKVSPDGIITTVVGTGNPGYSVDNGPALQAKLNSPSSIAFDPNGNLIIADTGNNRLRMVTPDGNISTIAGDGTPALTGSGGPAVNAALARPISVAVDSAANIFVLESGGTRVRMISPDSIISDVAGNGNNGFSGDGGPASASSFLAGGLGVDSTGNLYIADSNNDRIRVVLANAPSLTTTPGRLSFTASVGGAPSDPQAIAVSSSTNGLLVTARSDSPWLNVPSGVASAPSNIQVSVDPAGLDAGAYNGVVTLLSPGGSAPFATIQVAFTVTGAALSKLAVDASPLMFSLIVGGAPQSQSIRILNAGSGKLDFRLALSGPAAAGLTASVTSGSAQPNAPATVVLLADPAKLPAGTSSAGVTISSSTGEVANVPVTVTVAPRPQRMALSQRGLLFTRVQGGGVTPPQTFAVLNTGAGTFNWTAQAIQMSNAGWLVVTPGSGTSSSDTFGSITVSVNPAGLDPNIYYGLVRVSSNGAANAPQDLEVVLNLLSAQDSPQAVVAPAGLVFTATSRGIDPSSQTFQITNLIDSSLSFALSAVPSAWLTALPDHGTITPGSSQTVTVQPSAQLDPGIYHGSVAITVGSISRTVNVLLIITPAASAGSKGARSDTGCSSTDLYPVFTSFLQDFVTPASWPIPLEAKVVDNCGNPIMNGRVVTNFSNGDAPVSLVSLRDGRWQGTWFGGNARSTQIVVTVNADTDSPKLHGSLPYVGTLQANTDVPTVNVGGIASAAISAPQAPLAPGSVISISGKSFATGSNSASQLPLSLNLFGTQVVLAGRYLPLLYSSGGVINAIVPYDIDVDAQYQLIVTRGNAVSGPQAVAIAAAQPSIFKIDNTASIQVIADVWTGVTRGKAVDAAGAGPGSAIKSGDRVVIYCTGLGAINGPQDITAAAPSTPLSTMNAVSVTVGGQSAKASFAGLVPGYSGLYQVQFTVPDGVATGNQVPVAISVLGNASAPVMVAVH